VFTQLLILAKLHTDLPVVRVYIASAFGLASDTQKFLQWVHNTNAATPTELDFVDDAARQRWRSFVTSTSTVACNTPTAENLSPQFVRTYLGFQKDSLDKTCAKMKEAEKKMLVGSWW
jgi:hypothetical protein